MHFILAIRARKNGQVIVRQGGRKNEGSGRTYGTYGERQECISPRQANKVKGAAHEAAGDTKDAYKEVIKPVKNVPSEHEPEFPMRNRSVLVRKRFFWCISAGMHFWSVWLTAFSAACSVWFRRVRW